MIQLDYTIEAPDGTDISYGLAHFSQGAYAGVNVSCSWDSGAVASMTYWCYWNDLDQFILAMLGSNTVENVGGINRFSRFLPHQYPLRCMQNMWASKISSIKGVPGEDTVDGTVVKYPIFDGGIIEYRYAEVTVDYEPAPWVMLSDVNTPYTKEWLRFTTIQKTPRLDYIQAGIGTFYWINSPEVAAPGGTALPTPIPLREQSIDYIVTFHRCPEPFLNPFDYIGYANSYDGFLDGHPQIADGGLNAQTVQLIGMGEVPKPVAFTDIIYYDYQYFFKVQPNGFNKVRKVTSTPSFAYTAFSLDGLTPAAPTLVDPTLGNATRAIPLQDLAGLFLPN